MLKLNRLCIWVLSFTGLLTDNVCCNASKSTRIDTSTVKHLDVARYMGKWYEIARYDHRFEQGMTHVTAEYSLLPNGFIRVVNRGVKEGEQKEIIGKARQPHPSEYPGRLEVSFFLWFYADYYLLELDSEYQYAVVGSSSDKYLWILSRKPEMAQWQLEHILANLRKRGYDLTRLVYVKQ